MMKKMKKYQDRFILLQLLCFILSGHKVAEADNMSQVTSGGDSATAGDVEMNEVGVTTIPWEYKCKYYSSNVSDLFVSPNCSSKCCPPKN